MSFVVPGCDLSLINNICLDFSKVIILNCVIHITFFISRLSTADRKCYRSLCSKDVVRSTSKCPAMKI
jgi:hypothetical protein